jgi:hypothetical protein
MFLHNPMTVNPEKLTTRELKELIEILRSQLNSTPTVKTRIQMRDLAETIVDPVYASFDGGEMEKYTTAIENRLISEFGVCD